MVGKTHACTICKQKFKSHSELTAHKKQFHKANFLADKTKYKCTICHVTFARKCGLIRHLENIHNTDGKKTQSFNCIFCPLYFSSFNILKKHIYKKHEEIRCNDHYFEERRNRQAFDGGFKEYYANLVSQKIKCFEQLRVNDQFNTALIRKIRQEGNSTFLSFYALFLFLHFFF